MKTIFLSFSITNSSVSDFFMALSEKLAERCKVIIFTDINTNVFPTSDAITIYKWPSDQPKKARDFIFLYKKIVEHKPTVMVSNFTSVNVFLMMGFLCRVKNRIAWYHTLSSQFNSKKSAIYRKRILYRLATKIFSNSNATKNDLILNFRVNPEKIIVCYNAVKEYDIKRKVDNNKIVYAGRIHPSKGIDTLIRAMPIVINKFPKVVLTIIGGNLQNDEVKNLMNLVNRLKMQQNVIFVGNRTKQEVLETFSESYLCVVPSIVEAFGYVTIESFSVGTPVIGSNTSGIAEVIRDGVDGFLFNVNDEVDLADKIITLRNDAQLRDIFSENSRKRFVDSFEVKSATNRLNEYIINIA